MLLVSSGWLKTCRAEPRTGPEMSLARCPASPSKSLTPMLKGGSCWLICSGMPRRKFQPKWIVNLATLTGAILVALGKEYAGLFSNDDDLLRENLSAMAGGCRREGLASAARPRSMTT